MKIVLVQLENVRSHALSTVPFAKGFNCLVGGVGTGKSSILYAVDFALFGDSGGRSYDYLLRDDAENGKVMVQFIQNGKNYRISRGLRRRGKSISQDVNELRFFEDDALISSVKNEAVAEQLKAITGLDKELFRAIVWVKQEHLKELIDAAPRERQKNLDQLFGLSDYEEAWANLPSYAKEYEGEKHAYEKDPDVVSLQRLSTEYDRTAQDFSMIQIELEDTSKKLFTAKRALEEAQSKLRKMEEIRTLFEENRRREAQIQANLKNAKDTSNKLSKEILERKSFTEKVNQRLNSLETQKASYSSQLAEAGIDPNQLSDFVQRQLASIDDQIAASRGELETTLRDVRENEERMSSLFAQSLCPLCLQELNDDYKGNLVQRLQLQNVERQETVARLQRKIEELQHGKTRAYDAFSGIQIVVPRIADLKARVDEESQKSAELLKELEGIRLREKELLMQLDAVRIEISRFDLSELEKVKMRSSEALQQHNQIERDLRIKEDRKQSLYKHLDEIKERIDQAQQKIERMERIVKLIEIIGSIRDAYRNIQPKLRREFVKVLRNFVQQILDDLVGKEGLLLNILVDETYTPYIKSEGGAEREVSNLSGGERTLLAFAYRLGLGQLIMQSRTGHGLSMLLLDEPTESLGREDGSIERLAEAISRFKAIEQIIAVTHSEAFAEKAEHVIRLEKESGVSRVSVER